MLDKQNSPDGTIGPVSYQELISIIKVLRNTLNLKQEDITESTNVSIRTVKRIEKGEGKVRDYHLEEVCRALGYELKQESFYVLTPLETPARRVDTD